MQVEAMSSTSGVNSLLSSTSQTVPTYSISNILAASSGSSTTGIDVTAAVAAAIYADRAEERGWQADQTTLTGQTSALTTIQTATQAVNTDLESLNSLSGPLSARTVATSDSNAVTATAAAGTTLGDHTVEVDSVATTGSWYSDFQSSAVATLPTGSFTLTTKAGASQTFQTGTTSGTAGTNLNDLATSINSANLGVTATVVSDSSGSALSIVANTSGSAADFSISEPYTSWTAPTLTTGETLGANSITLTGATANPTTATITTTNGETYAQLATAINSAVGEGPSTSSSSSQASLTSTTALTAGSVTTIKDSGTGKTFSYTASAGDTIATLNSAIAAAVTAGTLSPDVTGAVVGGHEVISEGSTDKGIAVSTNDSVLGVMNAAPGATGPLGLTATATTDASGNQSLTIVSTDGSTPFTINEPSSTPGGFGFEQAIAGADASLTVDGVPLTSATNTVTGAIPGVTVNLLSATPGETIDLGVQSNASAVSTAINQLVSDYNTAINLVTSQFTVSSTTNSSGSATNSEGVLASDSTVVSLQSALEQAINYVYTPASGTTTVSSLNSLGITSNPDGTLSVDATTLNNAITNNPTDVQNFFEGPALNGFASSFSTSLNTYTDPANGAFTVDLHSISSESQSITSEINNFETNYISAQQTILTAEYSSAEVALQQLPEEMQQLNSELGFNNSGSNG
jgi:flagellar hook-associated protein 2